MDPGNVAAESRVHGLNPQPLPCGFDPPGTWEVGAELEGEKGGQLTRKLQEPPLRSREAKGLKGKRPAFQPALLPEQLQKRTLLFFPLQVLLDSCPVYVFYLLPFPARGKGGGHSKPLLRRGLSLPTDSMATTLAPLLLCLG